MHFVSTFTDCLSEKPSKGTQAAAATKNNKTSGGRIIPRDVC